MFEEVRRTQRDYFEKCGENSSPIIATRSSRRYSPAIRPRTQSAAPGLVGPMQDGMHADSSFLQDAKHFQAMTGNRAKDKWSRV